MRKRRVLLAGVVGLSMLAVFGGLTIWRNTFVVTRTVDVTFTDAEHGWALTTHGCGGWHRCLRILRTTDGGRSWQRVRVPPGAQAPSEQLACTNAINSGLRRCIDRLTFAADARTGYAWSDRLLYVTRDAGRTWSRGVGGARGVAATGDGVVRIPSALDPSRGGVLERSDPTARTWQVVSPAMPHVGHWQLREVRLVNSGGRLLLEVQGDDWSGEDERYRTLIFNTPDGGRTWRRLSLDPCGHPETTTSGDTQISQDGTVMAFCLDRTTEQRALRRSSDGGRTFTPVSRDPFRKAQAGDGIIAASSSVWVRLESNRAGEITGTLRTTDSGGTWHHVALSEPMSTSPAFPTTKFGYAVTSDNRGIEYTRDAGASWHAVDLP